MNALNTAHAEQSPGKTRINIEDPMAASKFAWDLGNRLRQSGLSPERPIILLCIGTDRSTGDCLGPLVGTKMDQLNQDFFIVYGTLDKPVHASNLRETLQEINTYFKNPFIIAVDACLGRLENVGSIQLGNGSLQPGAGVNKELPPVGQVHITGVVNVGGFMEYLVLQNTRLNLVMRLADVIVSGLTKTITEFHKQSTRGV